jgi:hypothetical protein
MRIYIDTEFTQLSLARQLISLALVSDAGNEFYVELNDTWAELDCSDFVKEIVLPQLDLDTHGLPFIQARAGLRAFLASLGPCEVIGDALRWDWPLFLELLGPPGLPENIIGCRGIDADCIDVELLLDEAPHHALLDARMLRDACEA